MRLTAAVFAAAAILGCAPQSPRPGGPLPPLPPGIASGAPSESAAPRGPDQTRIAMKFRAEGWSIRLPGAWETIKNDPGRVVAQQPAAPGAVAGRAFRLNAEQNVDTLTLEAVASLLRTREAAGPAITAERMVDVGGRRWAVAERGLTSVTFRAATVQGRYVVVVEWEAPANSGSADRAAFEETIGTLAPVRPR